MLKTLLIVALVAAYALASHFALILPQGKTIAAALAVGVPAAMLLAVLTQWLRKRRWLAAWPAALGWGASTGLACAVILMPLWWLWPLVLANADTLYFVQHVGTNALLAWVFGHTLAAGTTPLVVTFARMTQPNLPPELEAYARQVTVAWTLFFVLTCVISVLLFVAAPLAAWSTFAILLQWPSVAVFFVGEYALRKIRFKQFEHASLKAGFEAYRAYQNQSAKASSAPTSS